MSQARRWALTELLRRGVNFASFLIVARFLGVQEFSTFILLVTAFSFIVAIAQSSADRLLVRLWLRDTSQARLTARLATWFTVLATIIGALVCLSFNATEVSALILLYGVSITGQVTLWAEENRYRAEGHLPRSNRAKTFGEVAPSLGRAAGAIIAGSALGVCVGAALGAIGLLYLGRAQLVVPLPSRRLWRACRELALSSAIGVATTAYWRIDIFILAVLTDARAVASYAIAVRGLEVALILPSIYGQLSIADLVRNQRSAHRALVHGRRLVGVGAILAAVGVAASVPLAVFVTVGLDKPASAIVFAFLAATIPPAFYGAVIGNVLYASNREAALLRLLLVMLLANLLLNLLLVPWFGEEGAAAATFLTETAGVAWLAWRIRPRILRLTPVAPKWSI